MKGDEKILPLFPQKDSPFTPIPRKDTTPIPRRGTGYWVLYTTPIPLRGTLYYPYTPKRYYPEGILRWGVVWVVGAFWGWVVSFR